jgi:hypothetical protein
MKYKKYNTFGTILQSSSKIVEIGKVIAIMSTIAPFLKCRTLRFIIIPKEVTLTKTDKRTHNDLQKTTQKNKD